MYINRQAEQVSHNTEVNGFFFCFLIQSIFQCHKNFSIFAITFLIVAVLGHVASVFKAGLLGVYET